MCPHIPVMINEVMAALMPVDGEVYIDGTFGNGGYSAAFLESADCKVIAIDRDRNASVRAQELQIKYGDSLMFLQGCFGDAVELARGAGFEKVDALVLDLGVSSMQIDEADRGFSFRFDGPLDMRMDQGGSDMSAADLVNSCPEKELANILYNYGGERRSRRVAKEIVRVRSEGRIETTGQLATLIRKVVPKAKDEIDPATRSFQALRIAVNRELEELEKALIAAEVLLKEGGRLIVVSFHSLEDGAVKRFITERSGRKSRGSRHLPDEQVELEDWTFERGSRKAVLPADDEKRSNPRSRSARMRVAVRTSAPAWQGKHDRHCRHGEGS